MNPYTPPAEDKEVDAAAAVAKPRLSRRPAKPLRAFAVAVFGSMLFAGPYAGTAPTRALICAVTFRFAAVWAGRIYPRKS